MCQRLAVPLLLIVRARYVFEEWVQRGALDLTPVLRTQAPLPQLVSSALELRGSLTRLQLRVCVATAGKGQYFKVEDVEELSATQERRGPAGDMPSKTLKTRQQVLEIVFRLKYN